MLSLIFPFFIFFIFGLIFIVVGWGVLVVLKVEKFPHEIFDFFKLKLFKKERVFSIAADQTLSLCLNEKTSIILLASKFIDERQSSFGFNNIGDLMRTTAAAVPSEYFIVWR